jgi:hypothetical protein
MDYKLKLIAMIVGTDLEIFTEDSDKLDYAIERSQNAIANRIGCTVAELTAKYDFNIVEGAIWYLSRIGSEGEIENSEGGVTRRYAEVPDWLKSVLPKVGVVKVAGTR